MEDLYQFSLNYCVFEYAPNNINIINISSCDINQKTLKKIIQITMESEPPMPYWDTKRKIHYNIIFKQRNQYLMVIRYMEYFLDLIGELRHDLNNCVNPIQVLGDDDLKKHILPILNKTIEQLSNDNILKHI